MDQRSRPGPEPTTLEAVGHQWRYALVVVQAGDDEMMMMMQLLIILLANNMYHANQCLTMQTSHLKQRISYFGTVMMTATSKSN